ncbi:3-oxoacyl-[acyl-carrier protein] reductase [Prosthecobacter fusiformis]|uniref:3-oxoacyl-[acyl-carrier protein] reductase n=1 Tax=Prosthecobacter fusiformis TaxID=48464 RepID=A0A4R7S2M7_9BACT|nr:SDR family NAD(P)-dependent oxidoreductase [Prosthecobacter fusiformis]TDU71257.1 3-oxoacyl-[acyl-carrier protein] reductase [Prosthecobacter fusiformis]
MSDPRRILITGANGTLGHATARYFLEKAPDCQVFLGVRERREKAESLAASHPGRAFLCPLEITQPDSWTTALSQIETESGPLSVLINNAGYHDDALLATMTLPQWSGVLDANLNAVFLGCQAAIQPMMRQRWGRIINIASLSALHSPAGQTNYAAAKAGVIGLTQSLAKETARLGITVNAVCPGHIEGALPTGWSDEQIKAVKRETPMRRFARPEEIAAVVFFLASPEASYMTGASLKLDGALV